MKIGVVAKPWIAVPSTGYGAIEKFLYYLILEFSRQFDTTLFAPGDSKIPISEQLHLEALFDKGVGDWIFDENVEIAHALHAARRAHDLKLDVMNVHAVDAYLAIAPFLEIPTVFSVHVASHVVFKAISELSDNTHFVFLTESHRRQFPWISRADVVPLGVDTSRFPFSQQKADYLAFVGRLIDDKGCIEAIEIAKRAKLPLKMAGNIPFGSEQYFYKTLLPYIQRNPHVEFLGEVTEIQRNVLLMSAKALLFPIKWEEPFGLVMLEALVVGTPVVAFNRGSVPEILQEGVTGFIVNTLDEAVDAIEKLHAISSSDCRRSVTDRYSISIISERYLEIFKKLSHQTI